jgi:hypothetical protein
VSVSAAKPLINSLSGAPAGLSAHLTIPATIAARGVSWGNQGIDEA